jgi:hypothetical protein
LTRIGFGFPTRIDIRFKILAGMGGQHHAVSAKGDTTFVAAMRHDRIEAPWLLDGPMNGERFAVYVVQVLGPTLRLAGPFNSSSRRPHPASTG